MLLFQYRAERAVGMKFIKIFPLEILSRGKFASDRVAQNQSKRTGYGRDKIQRVRFGNLGI